MQIVDAVKEVPKVTSVRPHDGVVAVMRPVGHETTAEFGHEVVERAQVSTFIRRQFTCDLGETVG